MPGQYTFQRWSYYCARHIPGTHGADLQWILCASKDDAVVEYALSRSMSPTLVADYRLCLPDKTLLQNKLRELTELALESGEGNEGDEE